MPRQIFNLDFESKYSNVKIGDPAFFFERNAIAELKNCLSRLDPRRYGNAKQQLKDYLYYANASALSGDLKEKWVAFLEPETKKFLALYDNQATLSLATEEVNAWRSGTKPVPSFLLWYLVHQGFIQPLPVVSKEFKKTWLINDLPTKVQDLVKNKLSYYVNTAEEGLYVRGSSGNQRSVSLEVIRDMLENRRALPIRLVKYIVISQSSEPAMFYVQMEDCRSQEAQDWLAMEMCVDDFSEHELHQFPKWKMDIVVRNSLGVEQSVRAMVYIPNGLPIHKNSVRIDIQNAAAYDDTAVLNVKTLLRNNYISRLAEDSFRQFDEGRGWFDEALDAYRMKCGKEPSKEVLDLIAAAIQTATNARVVVESMQNGVRIRSLGGPGEMNMQSLSLPRLARSLRDVMPILREKRGAYYNGIIKSLEASTRGVGIDINNEESINRMTRGS